MWVCINVISIFYIIYICIYVALAPIFPWAPDVSRHVRPRRSNPTSAAPAPPAPPAAPARRAAAAPRGAPWVSEDARAPWRDEVMFQLNFLGKPWKKPRFLGDFLGIWWNMEYTGEIYAGFIGEKWIKLSSSKKHVGGLRISTPYWRDFACNALICLDFRGAWLYFQNMSSIFWVIFHLPSGNLT